MSELIKCRLNSIQYKFKKYIDVFYCELPDVKNNISPEKPQSAVKFIPIPYGTQPSQNVTINNVVGNETKNENCRENENKKEGGNKEKKNVSTTEIIMAGTLLTGVAVASTYVISNDQYLTFIISCIDDDINFISKNTNLLSDKQKTDFNDFKNIYESWYISYINKNKYPFYNKMAISGSAMGLIGGIFSQSSTLVLGGTLGIGLGCVYYAWKYFIDEKFNIDDNNILYFSMIDKLNSIPK